jgi:hypothetical protein
MKNKKIYFWFQALTFGLLPYGISLPKEAFAQSCAAGETPCSAGRCCSGAVGEGSCCNGDPESSGCTSNGACSTNANTNPNGNASPVIDPPDSPDQKTPPPVVGETGSPAENAPPAIVQAGSLAGNTLPQAIGPSDSVVGSTLPPAVVQPDSTTRNTPPRHRTFGVTTDLGLPDGAAFGVVVRPKFDWLRLNVAGTYNLMAPGVRVGVTIDPIAFVIAPTLTVEGGHSWAGRLPIGDAPTVGYTYANFHLGIEAGNRARFRFFVRGGVSWIDATGAGNVQGGSGGTSGVGIINPSYAGWLAPTAKLGISTYF